MLDVIRAAGVFMIIAQTMYHFVSGSKYARYVRLLIRIMTLAVLIVPLLDLIKNGTNEDFSARLEQFEYEYETILQETGYTENGIVEEQIARATADEIKTALDPVLAPYGYETAGVYAKENGLLFTLCPLEKREEEIGVRPVREVKVQIGEGAGAAGGKSYGGTEDGMIPYGTAGADAPDVRELSSVIAAFLRMECSQVEVRILA